MVMVPAPPSHYARHSAVPRCCIGLDLGKQTDFSALAMLRWHWPPHRDASGDYPAAPVYEVPTLRRWPLGTPYTEVVASVTRFVKSGPVPEASPLLVVDCTGVGEPVYESLLTEMFRARVDCSFCGVTITAGSAVTQHGVGRYRVAKKQLVSVLQVLLGNRRLQIAQDIPEARALQNELGTFAVKITESANETFESWRERDHDDLVLAVALSAWAAETLDYFQPPVDDGSVTVVQF